MNIDKHTLSRLISDDPQPIDWASLSSADWSLLLGMAQHEGVGPLLYWKFSKSGELVSLPEEVRGTLRAMYARTWASNQKMFDELGRLAPLLRGKDIPVVVLKGACFALTIYPDIGLRPMGDLDILVPASRLEESVGIARSLGYSESHPEASPGLNDLLGHHICLQRSGSVPVALEIHNSLVADKTFTYAVSVDWFWEQTELLQASLTKPGFDHLLMLSPTAQLLYAASHAMLQHGGHISPLRWYYDVDRLIRLSGDRLDWELLISQAREFEWGSALREALSRTWDYFGTPVPDVACSYLSLQADRHESLVKKKQNRSGTKIILESQRLISLNWQGRIRLVWALLVPSPAYMRWRYKLKNSWALPLFYPFRWWGIIKDALFTMIELLKRRLAART